MKRLILASLCVMFASTVAMGDWYPGDPYKMHFPQLPDPCGLDVAFDNMETLRPLGDDWLCTETGPVKDIHFWLSWQGDSVSDIVAMKVEIYDNNSEGPSGFSTPGTQLWSRDLYLYNPGTCEPDFSMILYGYGPQGWFNPFLGDGQSMADHYGMWQINIPDINRPYEQIEGNIYWLVITPSWAEEEGERPGWKTADVNAYPDPFTGDHFLDDAVYYDGEYWQELRYPIEHPNAGESIDLAFVITPEPATIALLGLGNLALLRRKRRSLCQ